MITAEVLVEMLILVLAWRENDRSFTTVDHVRLILEELGLLKKRQGAALFKDVRVQHTFKRSVVLSYTGSQAGNEAWDTRKPLLCLVPSDERAGADMLKMLRNYRVMITDVGRERASALTQKYRDTVFTRESVDAVETLFQQERERLEKERAVGSVIAAYNAKVNNEVEEVRRMKKGSR